MTTKHPEEFNPGPDFLRRLKRAGPRPRESFLQYTMRLAAIEAGRKLFYDTYRESSTFTEMCGKLGITIHNLHSYLARVGLTKVMLKQLER